LSDDIAFASLRELGTQLRRREISSEEIVRIAIDRTQKLDPKLNSYITFLPDQALKQARAADDALRRGQDLARFTDCRSASRTTSQPLAFAQRRGPSSC
jgi:Asp-tRNA(Asn)/Glu-tRNA(Gln) amidotransferase A subunit family amidase